MKLATFYNHIQNARKQTCLSRLQVLTRLKEASITGIEICYEDVPDLLSMQEELESLGMEVSSIYRTFAFETDADPAPGQELVDAAVSLGCKKIMPIPGFYPAGSDRDSVRRFMLKPLSDLVSYAQEKNITVTMEDFDNASSPIATSEGMKWFADRIEGLYYTFDTGNFCFTGEDEGDAFENLKEKIRHVHCKDRSLSAVNGENPFLCMTGTAIYPVSFGSGVIRCQEVLDKIRATGYDDYLVIEHFDANDQLGFLLQSAAWLKDWMEKS